MPRPNTITPADFVRWRQMFELSAQTEPKLREVLAEDEATIERVLYTGAWLGETLSELGCDFATMTRITLANGEAIEDAEDPWVPTVSAVLYYILIAPGPGRLDADLGRDGVESQRFEGDKANA